MRRTNTVLGALALVSVAGILAAWILAVAGEAKPRLAAKQFRLDVRTILAPPVADALVQELLIETLEPAEVVLTLRERDGAARESIQMRKRAGESTAKVRIVVLIEDPRGDDNFAGGSYLKFMFACFLRDEPGSPTVTYKKSAPAGPLGRLLEQSLQSDVYNYCARSIGNSTEVLRVGAYSLELQVFEPELER